MVGDYEWCSVIGGTFGSLETVWRGISEAFYISCWTFLSLYRLFVR